jgi:uncharacterized protein
LKLHVDPASHLNTVTGYGPGFVEINRVRHARSIVVAPQGEVRPWDIAAFADFDPVAVPVPDDCEVLLVGTGQRQHFPHPQRTRAWREAGLGVEFMDTPAACRTYNILMGEGRKVAAALILEGAST